MSTIPKAKGPVVLSEGEAFEREGFLGVDGLVDGDEVGAEARDGFAFFDFDDGEVGAGEGVFAGVLGCSGLAEGCVSEVLAWMLFS